MHAILILLSRMLRITAGMSAIAIVAIAARADIFQWEYINPADPSQGKQQSTTLAPDGAGVDAAPGAYLLDHNLTMAYLVGANLSGAGGDNVNLTDADLSFARFEYARLGGAKFTGADVRGARFGPDYTASGITLAQLYSTASYQAHDLSGISLYGINLAGGNFAGQKLTNAWFGGATLTDANFTNAQVQGAYFSGTGFTLAQLYSTASYKAHDLTGIALDGHYDLSGSNFVGQNLTNVGFSYGTLTGADFRQANLTNANFRTAIITDADFAGAEVRRASFSGISLAQLYSTASYQAHDLTGIVLSGDLSGGKFVGQNLTDARLSYVTLTGADFTGAKVRRASFSGITLAQLYSTVSYQAHDLTGIGLSGDLSGANFAGQNLTDSNFNAATLTDADFRSANLTNTNFSYAKLTGANFAGQKLKNANFGGANLTGANLREANLANASFAISDFFTICPLGFYQSCGPQLHYATLTGADLTAADARGAFGLNVADATTANLIKSDGHIDGLGLNAGGRLMVRDYDGPSYNPALVIPITVDQHLVMDPGSTLRMVFEADAWNATISFAPGILVALGGTLELTFADDVNLASQVGRTLRLFDWTGVNPTGQIAISSTYAWDLSHLYSSGEVTLTAVPEPYALFLISVAIIALLATGRFRLSCNSRKGEK